MKIDREIRTLICDLDGTLMNPGGGIRVSERVCNGLRRLLADIEHRYLHAGGREILRQRSCTAPRRHR